MTQNWDQSTSGESDNAAPGYPAYAPGYPPTAGQPQPGQAQSGPLPPGYPAGAGYQYPQGYPGAQGYPGVQGYPGAQGYQGIPGYPPGYPGYPTLLANRPPGSARAASVLAYVQAGLIIFAGLATINGSDLYREFGLDRLKIGPTPDLMTLMGLSAVVAGGLLIAGGVQILKKKLPLLLIGSVLSLCISVWWLAVFDFEANMLIWTMLLSAMPIISGSLALGQTTKRWISGQQ